MTSSFESEGEDEGMSIDRNKTESEQMIESPVILSEPCH